MMVCVTLPARANAIVEAAPRFMVFFRIEVVSLCDVKLSAVASLLDKRSVSGSQPRGDKSLRHKSLLPIPKVTGIPRNRQPPESGACLGTLTVAAQSIPCKTRDR